MKKFLVFFMLFVFSIFVIPRSIFPQSQTSNSISGFIFDASSRTPVSDVYVELLNDVYVTLKRIKTDGSGRYLFTGISSGTFKIKVLPYGTNYMEEIQDATITNYRFGSSVTSDSVYLDFYLKLDKRKIDLFDLPAASTVFVQEIPALAKDFYKKGLSQLDNPKEFELGILSLKKAIEIFPEYYDALDRLGVELVKRKNYFESLPFLVKSVTINSRSFSSFYMLGVAAYNLKQLKESEDAFKEATIIKPNSIQAQLQYGMVLRINGKYQNAEQILLKAKNLAKDQPIGAIHWQIALLYDKLSRFNEAADELEKYLKYQPQVENSKQVKELIKQLREKAKRI